MTHSSPERKRNSRMVNKLMAKDITVMQTLRLSATALAVFVPAFTAAFWIYQQVIRIELSVSMHDYREHLRADSTRHLEQDALLRDLHDQIQRSIQDQRALTCHVYEYPQGFCNDVRPSRGDTR